MSAFALIAIAALVTIPLVAYLSYRAKQQRIQAFAAMANQLGLTFAKLCIQRDGDNITVTHEAPQQYRNAFWDGPHMVFGDRAA